MFRKQKLLIYCILLISTILLNTGCGGLVGVCYRSLAVGDSDSYSELVASLPSIPEGRGRVFIYMVEGDPSVLNTSGLFTTLSLDNRIYHIAGATFFYADLRLGKHKVTASSAGKMAKGTFKKTFCFGENVAEFELSDQDVKYIKIKLTGTNTYLTARLNTYFPILVEPSQSAVKEINSLTFLEGHETNSKIGDTFF